MLRVYFYSPEQVTKEFHDLLKKREDEKTNCKMVHEELYKNKNNNEEVDVRV